MMEEKNVSAQNADAKSALASENAEARKERFEFRLSVNDSTNNVEHIVCQRYFHIHGFRWKAYNSQKLLDGFNKCVELIKKDLDEKRTFFIEMSAPQVFANEEEMRSYQKKYLDNMGNLPEFPLNSCNPKLVILRDSDKMFIWSVNSLGVGEFIPYEQKISRADYLDIEENSIMLKFAFLDNGREVISHSWDAREYPRFVRNNIDLTNSRGRITPSGYLPFDSMMNYLMALGKGNKPRRDLVPGIIYHLCSACSREDETGDAEFTPVYWCNRDKDGELVGSKDDNFRSYPYDIEYEYNRQVYKIGQKFAAKTEEYNKSMEWYDKFCSNDKSLDIEEYVNSLTKKQRKHK